MKDFGIVLLVLGVMIAFGALMMDTTVAAPVMPGEIDPGRVLNLGRLQLQELGFIGGCALFVAGAVLVGAGGIVAQLRHAEAVIDAPAPASYSPVELSDDEVAARAERQRSDSRLLYICLGVVMAVAILALAWNLRTPRSAADQAMINAADALADNIEMQADNLDAMAANAISESAR